MLKQQRKTDNIVCNKAYGIDVQAEDNKRSVLPSYTNQLHFNSKMLQNRPLC
jgi:hypothetical protein